MLAPQNTVEGTKMKVGLCVSRTVKEEHLTFAKRFGVTHIVVHTPKLGEERWVYKDSRQTWVRLWYK